MNTERISTPEDWLGVGGFVELDGKCFMATDHWIKEDQKNKREIALTALYAAGIVAEEVA